MFYINVNPYANVTESSSYADKIRASRPTTDLSKGLSAEQTRDVFERSGCSRITPGTYTKFAVINWPTRDNKAEMREVMAGYYSGQISKEDIREFFAEYCFNSRDENTILNVYETFLDANYQEAVWACAAEGKEYAYSQGIDTRYTLYYNADYYYRAEEMHELLQEAAKEYGEKYGLEIDASKRDEDFQGNMDVTGRPNFNQKWNTIVANNSIGRMMDVNAAPPEGFSFFYELGEENVGIGSSHIMINGKNWSVKMTVPYKNHSDINYFYLADLLRVDSDKENAKCYNDFLNKFVIHRINPWIEIGRR